ncbi:MAG TPA: 50S ribosomal protein L20 [Ktedonobacterales bacterium]|jgi:large subunit ribosomal protein L20|nr:50S ribosomal protein L20 [Ktedonobacterales bacterium]
MPRVKRGVIARNKHKKVLNRTEGHYGARHRLIKTARESMMHALRYAYRDRRNRKRDMRQLWITRINAAARLYGMRYGDLIHGLQLASVAIDRKILADLAVTDLATFGVIVKTAQAALEEKKAS